LNFFLQTLTVAKYLDMKLSDITGVPEIPTWHMLRFENQSESDDEFLAFIAARPSSTYQFSNNFPILSRKKFRSGV
jgi:hypothetical protein